MLQTLFILIAERLGPSAPTVAALAAGAGAFLWLLGARFDRSMFALVGVGLGTWLGLHLPRWYAWPVDPMAVAIGAAMALGLAGYLLHTLWVGMLLAVELAMLMAAVAWVAMAGGASWSLPALDWSASQTDILNAIWRGMPGDLPRAMPCAMAMGAVSGVAITLGWAKVARVLAFSLLGLAIFTVFGGAAAYLGRPDLLGLVPRGQGACVALAMGLAVLGALVQWWSLPAPPAKVPPAPTARPVPVSGPGELATGGAKA